MIATIIVGYKNDDLTIQFVTNELIKTRIDNVVVLVNNASTEDSNFALASNLNGQIVHDLGEEIDTAKRFFVISSEDNLGFARANNLGATFIHKYFPSCAFLLFSNNDIKIIDSEVINVLISKLISDESIGIITPNIIGRDGKRQTPQRKHSIIPSTLYLWISILSGGLFSRVIKSYSEKAEAGYHYSFSECFFMTRTDYFIRCGMMDPATFLYAEGLCLTERMLKINKRYFFEPSVTVVHENGTTTRKSINQERMTKMMSDSNLYYYKTYRKASSFELRILELSTRLRIRLSKIKRTMLYDQE